jgi:hypothetical protein
VKLPGLNHEMKTALSAALKNGEKFDFALNSVDIKKPAITGKVILSNEYIAYLVNKILGKFLLPFAVIGKTRSGI